MAKLQLKKLMASGEETCNFCVLDGPAISIFAQSLNMGLGDHPNAIPFEGTLLRLDSASDQPPQGALGHRIFVPHNVAVERLDTLLNMGVNYQPDGHQPKKKIGVITAAWIDGNAVKVKGVIYGKDFPEETAEIKANSSRLGMSMELANVWVRDKDSSTWTLDDFHFTGAAILSKRAAAYHKTSLQASKEKVSEPKNKTALAAAAERASGGNMSVKTKEKEKKVAAASTEDSKSKFITGLQAAFVTALKPLTEQITEQNKSIKELFAKVEVAPEETEEVEEVEAAGDPSAMPNPSDPSMQSKAADPSADDSSADDSSADDSSAYEAAGAQLFEDSSTKETGDPSAAPDPDSKPGQQNSRADSHAKAHAKAHLSASADKKFLKTVNAQAEQIKTLTKENKKLANRIEAIQAQNEKYAESVSRKSVTPEVRMLLEKNGFDVAELKASGEKIPVSAVDKMLEALATTQNIQLDPVTRMHFKNQLFENGLMDAGEVTRTQ